VLLVWTRLIMPNGRSIVLERQQAADAGGHSGLEDEVDNHWKELLGAAALSTLLGVGSELGSGADNGNNTAIWPTDCPAQSEYPADIDNPARLSGARDR